MCLYVGDTLRDPVTFSPLVTRAIYSRGAPYIGCMGPSVVVGLVGRCAGR